jgi:pimeloyl-ACP methyl ester carboxylesterase
VALQSLAYDPRLRFGIVESTFSDFRNTVYDYQWRMFKVSSHTFADWAIERAAAEAHFQPDSIRPEESARGVHQPVLMTHGSDDERISISYGKRNYNKLASTDKQFYEVHGANHNNLSAAGGKPYFDTILTFLKRQ